MIFSIFDIDQWYDIVYRKTFSIDKFNKYLDQIQKIGFDYVNVDEKTLPEVHQIIQDRGLGMIYCPSYVKGVTEKKDNTFDVEFYRNDLSKLNEDDINISIEKTKEYCRIYFDNCGVKKKNVIVSVHLGCFLESTFVVVDSKREILEGIAVKNHDIMISLFDKIMRILTMYFDNFLFHSQIQGFGAENRIRHELNPMAVCEKLKRITHNVDGFYYYTPTEFSHDGKYLLDNIISQEYIKRCYGIKNAWGAMGIYGFPTTATSGYLNNVNLMNMVVGEKTYGKNRLTYWNFDSVDNGRVEIIRQTIEAIRKNDKEKILWINRHYSQECGRNSVTNHKIYDEHFSLDGM